MRTRQEFEVDCGGDFSPPGSEETKLEEEWRELEWVVVAVSLHGPWSIFQAGVSELLSLL